MIKRLALAAALCVAATTSSLAVAAPPPPKPVTTVEGISEFVLANGMHVLLFADSSKETFTVNVTYLVGSRMEGYGETGMAHLLEHMMFKGSPKHPKVWEELKQRGAANNASTWYDRTNYFETLPVKGDNLKWALELEADRMLNANIAQADLNSEFSVVRNEFEIGENKPDEVLSERMWSTAYLWHNYGKSTIGSRADIEKVPATSLKRYYKKYYRPDNAILIIAGKFDPKVALDLANNAFGGLANPREAIEPTYTTEPVQDGERVVTLRRNGDVQIVSTLYHVGSTADADYAAVQALEAILTDEPSGRLYQALVKTGLASNVASQLLVLHDPGVLEIDVTVPVGKPLDVVKDKLIAIVEGAGKAKVTDEELARFKAKSKKRFKLAFANSGGLSVALSEYIGAGDWRLFFLTRDRITALTPATVQKAAADYFVASNRTLGTFVPDKTPARAPLRETPDAHKIVGDYKGEPPVAEGEKFDATIANIEKRTVRSQLADGMKLAVLQKTTRGHVVRAQLTMRYGTEADFTNVNGAVDLLGDMLERGTKKHTFQQIKDQFDILEAQVGFTSGPGAVSVSIQTTHDNFPAVLALVDEMLREPTLPADQFGLVVKEQLTALDDQKSDPESQVFIAERRAVSPYPKSHPLYTPTSEEEIAQLKAMNVGALKKYPAMFGMSNATLTVIGDADGAAVKAWADKTWGTWKSPRPWKRIEKKFTATAGAATSFDFPDKANAWIMQAFAVDMKDDDADAPAMLVANYVLGGGGFVSRLTTRLRQKDGLTYQTFSGWVMPPLDAAGQFLAAAALNPTNAKKGMAAMTEEIDRLVTAGVPAQELADAKKGMQSDFDRNLSNDNAVMSMLGDGLYLGRTLEFWAKRYATIAALTTDQLNAAIKKHLKPASLVKITSGDQKKM